MRPEVVVINSPFFDDLPCVCKISKPMKIEAFVSEFPVEALDETILDGPTWLNENKLDPPSSTVTSVSC